MSQTGQRTAKAWLVDTSHMNPRAEDEEATLEAGAVDVVFTFNPSTTAMKRSELYFYSVIGNR